MAQSTHVYIVFHSATMLMFGPSTFIEDEDEDEYSRIKQGIKVYGLVEQWVVVSLSEVK